MRFEYKESDYEKGVVLKVHSEGDWAEYADSRRSGSRGIATITGGVVKSWSNRQASEATFSGEVEYYAVVKACAEALKILGVAKDLGWYAKIQIYADSSDARAIATRSGLKRARHMEVRYLWIQEVVSKKRLVILKINGKANPADVLTKSMSRVLAESLLRPVGVVFEKATK